jgi:hypothetical protein
LASAPDFLNLQRVAGNEAVTGLIQLQRAPADAPVADAPTTKKSIDLFPKDVLDRHSGWQDRMPSWVRIDIYKGAPEAGKEDSKTQLQISYGRTTTAHTAPVGPGAEPGKGPSSDLQDQLGASVTMMFHEEGKPGVELAAQAQMGWDPTLPANANSVSNVSSVQAGGQVSLVSSVWHQTQASIYLQVMGGAAIDPAGAGAQGSISGGGQLSYQLTKSIQLFVQGGVGATVTGTGRGPSATGDLGGTIGVGGSF